MAKLKIIIINGSNRELILRSPCMAWPKNVDFMERLNHIATGVTIDSYLLKSYLKNIL